MLQICPIVSEIKKPRHLISCRRKGCPEWKPKPLIAWKNPRDHKRVPRCSGDEETKSSAHWKDPGETGTQKNATPAQQHLNLAMIAFYCLCTVSFNSIIYSSNENNYLLVLDVRIVMGVERGGEE